LSTEGEKEKKGCPHGERGQRELQSRGLGVKRGEKDDFRGEVHHPSHRGWPFVKEKEKTQGRKKRDDSSNSGGGRENRSGRETVLDLGGEEGKDLATSRFLKKREREKPKKTIAFGRRKRSIQVWEREKKLKKEKVDVKSKKKDWEGGEEGVLPAKVKKPSLKRKKFSWGREEDSPPCNERGGAKSLFFREGDKPNLSPEKGERGGVSLASLGWGGGGSELLRSYLFIEEGRGERAALQRKEAGSCRKEGGGKKRAPFAGGKEREGPAGARGEGWVGWGNSSVVKKRTKIKGACSEGKKGTLLAAGGKGKKRGGGLPAHKRRDCKTRRRKKEKGRRPLSSGKKGGASRSMGKSQAQ